LELSQDKEREEGEKGGEGERDPSVSLDNYLRHGFPAMAEYL